MKKNNKQQKSEITKGKIIESVRKILKHKDLNNMKIREICTDANISVGTFYLYFPSKEAAVLYGYREADLIFERLNLTSNSLDNINLILKSYLSLVNFDNLDIIKQIYICHLSYYDEYFFDTNRVIFNLLNKEINTFLVENNKNFDSKEITLKLLEFCRGHIYNLCISDLHINKENWHNDKLIELVNYFKFLTFKTH